MSRRLFALALVLALASAGCGWLGFTWGPGPGRGPARSGDPSRSKYLAWPADGASGVPLVPTVRWNRAALAADLEGLSRLVLQVATLDGRILYRLESLSGGGDESWLLAAESARVFSRPAGTVVQADPEFAESGRLKPATAYRLSLLAESQPGKGGGETRRVFESATFETLEVGEGGRK